MNPDDLIPIIIVPILFLSLAFVAAFAISNRTKFLMQERDMLNRERLSALDKGVNVPLVELPKIKDQGSSLKTGMILVAVGIGIALLGFSVTTKLHSIGALVALIGVAHLLYWHLNGRKEWESRLQWEKAASEAYLTYMRELTESVRGTRKNLDAP